MDFTNRILEELPKIYKKTINNLLYVIVYTISDLFKLFDEDFKQALAETSILTASDFWLKFWGSYFNLDKFPSEDTESYRNRLLTWLNIGSVNKTAILEAIRQHSATEPTITEYNGEILIKDDYASFDYATQVTRNAYIVRIIYRPRNVFTNIAVVDKSFVDYNAFTINIISYIYDNSKIKIIANNVKMAGIKLVFKTE